jgi:cyclopropane fatty-acyl-phospholipid synthase-like methyltransferase
VSNYLDKNHAYWQKGYDAPHVESFIFRTYGRILKPDFGLTGEKHEKVLDFGCGEGANLSFFKAKGFQTFGVDISEKDIQHCQQRIAEDPSHFQVISAKPNLNQDFPGNPYDLVIAIQSLYYLAPADLDICLNNLYRQMKPGALIFASMMGTKSHYFKHAQLSGENLYEVRFPENHRLQVRDYFMQFVESESQLVSIFHKFNRIQIGYYDASYREDEGSEFHYTFLGQKPEVEV